MVMGLSYGGGGGWFSVYWGKAWISEKNICPLLTRSVGNSERISGHYSFGADRGCIWNIGAGADLRTSDQKRKCICKYDAVKVLYLSCLWNEDHMISIERVEDEYFVRIDHEMTKTHHISFIAAVSSDRSQMVKLYPEGEAGARFKINGVRKICFYCNRDGLFCQDIVKGIDDKESGYDDTKERRELEKTADMLFG